MGRNRPSNENAPRVPSEEGGRPGDRIIVGLIFLLLLALLIPFACQALSGGSAEDQKPGAQNPAGTENKDDGSSGNGSDGDSGGGSGGEAGDSFSEQAAAEGENTTAESNDGQSSGQGGEQSGVRAEVSPPSGQTGDEITIPRAEISGADGWIAVHADDSGDPGAVIGYAPIQEGENTDVEVKLDQPVDSGTLYAMVHAEDPADGDYTFPDGDPPVDQSGGMVVESFEYAAASGSASGSASEPDSESATGSAEDEPLPDSGGFAPLALAGVILIAAGSLVRRNLRA